MGLTTIVNFYYCIYNYNQYRDDYKRLFLNIIGFSFQKAGLQHIKILHTKAL